MLVVLVGCDKIQMVPPKYKTAAVFGARGDWMVVSVTAFVLPLTDNKEQLKAKRSKLLTLASYLVFLIV